jgi:hypothetical protein
MRAAFLNVAGAAAAIGVIITPAVPANADSAVETIGILRGQGFNVTIDRIGSAPLSDCVVTDVRNPQNQTSVVAVDRSGPGHDRDLVPVVTRRSITVSLDCSG